MLDRLERLLRSFLADGGRMDGSYDPDLDAAREELDSFLSGNGAGGARKERQYRRHGGFTTVRDKLEEAYAVLELSPGASMEKVRESYKRLLFKYHPDRFVGNPEKQRAATEVAQAVIGAYRTIRASKE